MTAKLVLDANLTVLLIVGRLDTSLIERHKRLQAYRTKDYTLLADMVSASDGLIFTPNILTETSNLLRQDREPRRSIFAASLGHLVNRNDEIYVESSAAVDDPRYLRLGLSDASILMILQAGHCLLTADVDLYVAACQAGHQAINFHHMRDITDG